MTATVTPLFPSPRPGRARPCAVPGCGKPGRLYPEGWRCEGHAPGPAVTRVAAAEAGTGSRSALTVIPRHLEAS